MSSNYEDSPLVCWIGLTELSSILSTETDTVGGNHLTTCPFLNELRSVAADNQGIFSVSEYYLNMKGWTRSSISGPNITSSPSRSVEHHRQILTTAAAGDGGTDDLIIESSCSSSSWFKNKA
ncbi:hypothetical protein T459_14911 [Capsicum annuum]|uniref:Uncharacterized protein n=1 Tax=Capsicum annuum TaxID=4072 RepID=A0A2G2ZIU2_CAPAN|nr:hypothetical protein T459_14911 [Capsicum annuum]